jgi:hypothetical protein
MGLDSTTRSANTRMKRSGDVLSTIKAAKRNQAPNGAGLSARRNW